MPFEIIHRKEGEMSQKQEIRHSNVQISINDWGHLVIREFEKPTDTKKCRLGDSDNCNKNIIGGNCWNCEHYKTITTPGEEHLIVFDRATTDRIIDFIFSVRTNNLMKQLLENILKGNYELPF